eukprot:gene9140-12326_t
MKQINPNQSYKNKKYYDSIKQKELQKQRNLKSSMLRKYAKLCKSEGIASDRVNLNDEVNSTRKKDKKDNHQEKKTPRILLKAQQIANEKEEQRKVIAEQKERIEKEKSDALIKRQEKRRIMMQKTTKGQPKLGNRIQMLLSKISNSQ